MQHSHSKKINKTLVLSLAFLIFIQGIFLVFFISFFMVYGKSMESTLKHGDIVAVVKKNMLEHILPSAGSKDFIRDKIIVFRKNGRFSIKRCVGIEGDTLIMVPDTFIVPEGNIFTAGDNYRFSVDSRENGYTDIDSIYAYVFCVIFTRGLEVSRLGSVK